MTTNRFTRRAVMIAFGMAPILLVVGLVNSPRPGESGARYAVMQSDMGELLKLGGSVGRATDSAKANGAYSSRQLAMEGWSAALAARYRATLVQRGWQVAGPDKFCKSGMLARLVEHAGMQDGQAFNLVEMAFDRRTADECGKVKVVKPGLASSAGATTTTTPRR